MIQTIKNTLDKIIKNDIKIKNKYLTNDNYGFKMDNYGFKIWLFFFFV